MSIRPALLYGSECWATKKDHATTVGCGQKGRVDYSRWCQKARTTKRKWEDCLRSDLMDLALTEDMTSDRKVWRLKTRTMTMEVGMHKIRVNSISPGLLESEITKELMKEWLKEVVMKAVPLRRLGRVDPALTSLIKYLFHDSSEYATGNVFIVDSGATLPVVPIFSL
ncbi:protein RADIALIS-like 1-like [Hibiscus syriacus]|uniref:Protein RADIALIS-like 1-like n=1 Tax=Hibiscus syriacus TaxID=106335 RepID=A0A6A2XD51_HIBSY|nr:protein RADIALIS-like 1-like [Hibiscus syriacus]